jgi:hypothetical protein
VLTGFTPHEAVPEKRMKLAELIKESLHILTRDLERGNGVDVIWCATNW